MMRRALETALKRPDKLCRPPPQNREVAARRQRKVCLATFNYDLLLDDAAYGQLGLELNTVGGYVQDDRLVCEAPRVSELEPARARSWRHALL